MRLKFPIHSNHVLRDSGMLCRGEGYTEGSNELKIRKIIDQYEFLDCLHRVPLALHGSHDRRWGGEKFAQSLLSRLHVGSRRGAGLPRSTLS